MKKSLLVTVTLITVLAFFTFPCFGGDDDGKRGLKWRVEALEQTVALQQEQIAELHELILSQQNCCVEAQNAISSLDARVLNAEADISSLKSTDNDLFAAISGNTEGIWSLQTQVNSNGIAIAANTTEIGTLDGRVDIIEPKVGKLCPPDYDSGWVVVGWDTEELIFTHNLGTRDLFVYIYYRMNDPTIPSPDYTATHNIRAHQVYWFAYDYNAIRIGFPIPIDYVWQEIRVLTWAIPD